MSITGGYDHAFSVSVLFFVASSVAMVTCELQPALRCWALKTVLEISGKTGRSIDVVFIQMCSRSPSLLCSQTYRLQL